MNNSQATPMWLDLQTTYIDANFDKFLRYLQANQNANNDSFYTTSLDLLRRRVDELIDELSNEPMWQHDQMLAVADAARVDYVRFAIRLLGVYLLSDAKIEHDKRREAFVYQLLLLAQLCKTEDQEPLAQLAVKALVRRAHVVLPYGWSDVEDLMVEVFVAKVLAFTRLQPFEAKEVWFEGVGSAVCHKGVLSLTWGEKKEYKSTYPASIKVCDGCLTVVTPQNAYLKSHQQSRLDALVDFSRNFMAKMKPAKEEPKQILKRYSEGDKGIEVRVTKKLEPYCICVETTSADHEVLKGDLLMNPMLGHTFADCMAYLKVGDLIPVMLSSLTSQGTAKFDMTPEFKDFILSDRAAGGDVVLARAVKVNNGNTMWFTEMGYIAYTQKEEYEEGTVAELMLLSVPSTGYITARFEGDSDLSFDEDKSRRNCIESFCFEPPQDIDEAMDAQCTIEKVELQALCKALYVLQRSATQSVERFKILSVLRILCRMLGAEVQQAYVEFVSQYFNNVIFFAKGDYDKLYEPEVGEELREEASVQRRLKTLRVLRCYGNNDDNDFLEEVIDDENEAMLAQIGRLIQSCNRLQDVLSAPMLNAIKRELTKMLAVDEETGSDLDEETGIYLGIEDGHQEFKTSFVYPPDNRMQPDAKKQRTNVFKGVCAFLNSESGGTLYLGVNDLGVVVGLESDLKYLKVNLDGYMRHITDEAKAAFGLGVVTTFIDIRPMYDERVVALQIKPCDYKVVELDGTSYIRANAESRIMPESLRLLVQGRKRSYDKGREAAVSSLQSAIDNKRQVIAHGYSSSNSGQQRDRLLEPFAFVSGYKYVWCFDPSDMKVKLFAVARIGNVEILENQWQYAESHKEGQLDIFNMTGEERIHVVLELDRMARNLLVEEYPASEQYLIDFGDDRWQLDVEVSSLYGIGRFYVGLVPHISIVDAPQLKEYAVNYYKDCLKLLE